MWLNSRKDKFNHGFLKFCILIDIFLTVISYLLVLYFTFSSFFVQMQESNRISLLVVLLAGIFINIIIITLGYRLFFRLNKRIILNQFRDIKLEDLLGRASVALNEEGINEYIKGKRMLVTGGGGSIGSELCRQIVKFNPSELMVLDIYENNAYEIQQELISKYPQLKLKVFIASIRDKSRLENIFKAHNPEIIYHAAAHKHVPLMEQNQCEAIKNNVFGTLNLVDCANKYNAKKFVLISSDKAVNPTNVMGASKRICEMIIQAMDPNSKTEFVAVRFGNVLGSNGSVIPLFKSR